MHRWFLIICLVVSACSDRVASPIVPEALNIGHNRTVFVGTTRKEGPPGTFGIGRSEELRLAKLIVSIPPNRDVGTISDGLDKPRPEKDFVLANRLDFDSGVQFRQALARDVQASGSPEREVTLFIHGYNNSFADSVFRIAQLAEDLELPGSFVSYAWPSRGNPLGYQYDVDSALFARDGLQELMFNIERAGINRIVLVAHSMGSTVLMETLRQIEIANPGWVKRNISGVILLSPDLNVDVFRSQVRVIQELPDPFVIFVSKKDIALRLSARLRGEETQLGNLTDLSLISDLPISIVDVSAFRDRKSGNHFVAGGSSALISLLNNSDRLDREFAAGRVGAVGVLPGRRRVLRNAAEIILEPLQR